MKNSKPVIELSSTEAKDFFLKHSSFCRIDLPQYINFEPILTEISDIWTTEWRVPNAKDSYNVCYNFLANKDGFLGWRPLSIIHPVLYVALVDAITEECSWKELQDHFAKDCTPIISDSIPRRTDETEEENHSKDIAADITNWWQVFERESIIKSLKYSHLICTDISACYESIYTHSISWALHTKEKAKTNRRGNDLLGNRIDELVRNMTYGETNGIPQGSMLMDFVAEIVLKGIDIDLQRSLDTIELKDCCILRYRDDYRIFTNTQADGQVVLKELARVLADWGMRLNTKKTLMTDDLVYASLKPYKWYGLDCLECHNKRQSRRKHLLRIYKLAKEFPNAGGLKKRNGYLL